MQRQGGELAPMGGDPALIVERTEVGQERPRFGQCALGRRGQKGQIVAAPKRQFERKGGKIGGGNLGRGEGSKRPFLALCPEPVAAPLGHAPRAARALCRLGASHALGHEARHPRAGVIAGAAGAAGINHHADIFDGERGLGDRR